MLKIPGILNSDDFLNRSLDYLWDDGSSTFYFVDAHNERISKALWSINHKATLGIATALSEWVFWRLSKYINRPAVNQALEAHWAGIIDKCYMVEWQYNGQYMSEPDRGPLWVIMSCLQYPRTNYLNGNYFVNKKVSNLAMLARHVSPNPEFFDDWFKSILTKSAKFFPAQYNYAEIISDIYNRENGFYDSSKEPAIPREFFWQDDYEMDNYTVLISQFLSCLNYKESRFLNHPNDMKTLGFVGIPYVYKD